MLSAPVMNILSLATASFLLFQMVYDYVRHRKERKNVFLRHRILVCCGGLLLFLEDIFLSCPVSFSELTLDVGIVGCLLLAIPDQGGRSLPSVLFSILLLSYNLLLRFIPHLPLSVLGSLAAALCFFAVGVLRGRDVPVTVFRNNAFLRYHEETLSRLFHTFLLMGVGAFATCSAAFSGMAGTLLQAFSFLAMLALEAILFQRAVSGRYFLRAVNLPERLEPYPESGLEVTLPDGIPEEERRMRVLYKRILLFMEEERPYLDADYDMNRLAHDLYSNKLYLSKTINLLSGRNFRQFINRYRILYAVEIMKKDPRQKLMDVSEQSGFHTVVSFNMAFKINLGKTPSDWIRDYLASRSLGR